MKLIQKLKKIIGFKDGLYASFFIRLLATIIDLIVITIFTIIIVLFIKEYNYKIISKLTDELFLGVLNIVIVPFYYIIMESSRFQATIGKKVVGLTVVNTEHKRLSFFAALVRNYSKSLSALFLGFGYLAILGGKYRQGWHDAIAGSLVIKKNSTKC